MKKKALVSIILLVIIAAAAGGWFWWKWYEEKLETGAPEKLKNYAVKETPEGQVIENKNVGLSFKVPNQWKTVANENIQIGGEQGFTLMTPEMEPRTDSPYILVPQKGCLINAYVYQGKERMRYIEEDIKEVQQKPPVDRTTKSSVVEIDGKAALKSFFGERGKLENYPGAFLYQTVEVPFEDKVYTFETYFPLAEEKKCTEEFDDFLREISIKP